MTLLGVYKLDKPKTWMKRERKEREREELRMGKEEGWEGGRLESSLRNRVVSALP